MEFSKCVRRHQVTKAFGSPVQPLALRNGAAASRKPPCISTTVPYWSNMHSLILDFRVWMPVMAVSRWFGSDDKSGSQYRPRKTAEDRPCLSGHACLAIPIYSERIQHVLRRICLERRGDRSS